MKKALCALCALLMLAGCGKTAAARFAPRHPFTAAFSLYRGDYEITGTLECRAYNDIRLTFTHPEALCFLTLTAGEEGLTASVAGVPDTVSFGELPAAAPLKTLVFALRQAVFRQNAFTRAETGFETVVPLQGGPAACRFSPEGLPRSIRCGDTVIWFKT